MSFHCSTDEPDDIDFELTLTSEQERKTTLIPAGYFMRGNSWITLDSVGDMDEIFYLSSYNFDTKEWDDILIEHDSVYVESFSMSCYEVSNRFYSEFVEEQGYRNDQFWSTEGIVFRDSLELQCPKFWDLSLTPPYSEGKYSYRDDHPVIGISWYEAEAFCNWYGDKIDAEVRLPTEAEWEKAARWSDPAPQNGIGSRYPWGDQLLENYYNGRGAEDGFVYCAPVNSFDEGISHYGIYHLCGNVWEWCLDWYGEDYYKEYYYSDEENPLGPVLSPVNYKVVRGGDCGPCFAESYRNCNRHALFIQNRSSSNSEVFVNDLTGIRFVVIP